MKTCRFLLLVLFQIVLTTELDPAAIREQPFNNKLPLAKLPLERMSRGHLRSGLLCFDGCGRPIVRVKITLPCYRGPPRPCSRHAETTDELLPKTLICPGVEVLDMTRPSALAAGRRGTRRSLVSARKRVFLISISLLPAEHVAQ